jgi:hypothetical protein
MFVRYTATNGQITGMLDASYTIESNPSQIALQTLPFTGTYTGDSFTIQVARAPILLKGTIGENGLTIESVNAPALNFRAASLADYNQAIEVLRKRAVHSP